MNVNKYANYIVHRNCEGEVTGTFKIHSCSALEQNMNFGTSALEQNMNFGTFLLKLEGGVIAVVGFGSDLFKERKTLGFRDYYVLGVIAFWHILGDEGASGCITDNRLMN